MDESEYHAAMERSNRLPDVSALRRDLVAAGYTPLPLFGKTPPAYGKNGAKKGLGRWQHLENVTDGQIDDWARHWPDAINTGILTKYAPALTSTSQRRGRDRDRGSGRAALRGSAASSWSGSVRPPKRAILFRTEDAV